MACYSFKSNCGAKVSSEKNFGQDTHRTSGSAAMSPPSKYSSVVAWNVWRSGKYGQQCLTCAKDANPAIQELIASELPEYPWQKIGTDLFQLNGKTYLVVVDYFSRYPEVRALNSTTSRSIISALKDILSRLGIPETVMSDNGPQYASSEFSEFSKLYDFEHITSSPLYPQSNGQVERIVQTVKRLLKQSKDPYMAPLTYRSTPFPWCKLSPSELLMGRRTRSNVPLVKHSLKPDWKYLEGFRANNEKFKLKQKRNYDHRHRTKSLTPLPINSEVWITSGTEPVRGTVVANADSPRSYIVETPNGQVRRNREHLNIVPGSQEPPEQTQPRTQPRSLVMTRMRTGTLIVAPDRLQIRK